MATNDLSEVERRDPELPLKEEVCAVFSSSTIYESLQVDWRMTRVDSFEVQMPSMRSEPPLHASATDSKEFRRDVVEELIVKNFAKPGMDQKYKGPVISEAAKSKAGQWSHLYQFAGGQHKPISFCGDSLAKARDQLMLNARDNLGRSNLDILEHRRSVDKNVHQKDEDCCEMTSSKKIRSAVIAPNVGSSVLSNPSFSSFFKSRNVKGEEPVGGCRMSKTLLDVGQNDCGDKNEHLTVITSDASLEHDATIKELSRNSADGFSFNLDQGISLRELLKPGHSTMNKVERLSLFRKIVEIVDNVHSQGVVMLNLLLEIGV